MNFIINNLLLYYLNSHMYSSTNHYRFVILAQHFISNRLLPSLASTTTKSNPELALFPHLYTTSHTKPSLQQQFISLIQLYNYRTK